MKIVDRIALVLVIIGALNWGGVGAFQLRLRGLPVRRADRRRQPHHLYAGGHRRTVVHHPAVPRGWDGEHKHRKRPPRGGLFSVFIA